MCLCNTGPVECSSKLSSSSHTCQAEAIHTPERNKATFIAAKRLRSAPRRETNRTGQSEACVCVCLCVNVCVCVRRGLVMYLLESQESLAQEMFT